MGSAAQTNGGGSEGASTSNEASASARTSNSAATKTSDSGDANAQSTGANATPEPSSHATSGAQHTSVPSTSASSGLTSSSSSSSGAAPLASGSSQSALDVSAIVGIVVGVVAVALMVAAFVIWYKKIQTKSRRLDKLTKSAHETDGLSPSTRNNGEYDIVLESGRAEPPIALLEAASEQAKRNAWEDPSILMARIPLDKLVVLDVVSRGASGVVFRGTYKNEPVAIKRLLPALQRDMLKIDAFLAEIKLMASMEHERIVAFVGVAWDALQDLSLVSEFMDGGDLCSVLERFEDQGRAHGFDADKLRIALHVAHALTYLHSLEPVVLHRDLKSKNVLLNARLEAKLTDFGVSRGAADGDRTMTAGIGTSWWMAPEVMIGDRYDAKADMFSFGILLSELDSQALPYSKVVRTATGRPMPSAAMLQMITAGTLRVELSAGVPSALRDLGDACVDVDPAARPSAAEALYELQKLLREHQ